MTTERWNYPPGTGGEEKMPGGNVILQSEKRDEKIRLFRF